MVTCWATPAAAHTSSRWHSMLGAPKLGFTALIVVPLAATARAASPIVVVMRAVVLGLMTRIYMAFVYKMVQASKQIARPLSGCRRPNGGRTVVARARKQCREPVRSHPRA